MTDNSMPDTFRTCRGPYVTGFRLSDGREVYPEFEELSTMPRDWMDYDKERPISELPEWALKAFLEQRP
jgi:hypothetical protein